MRIEDRINSQEAEIALLRLLIGALVKQTLNPRQLIADFSEASEDSAVRAMNSAMPEAFFQGVLEQRDHWLRVLSDIAQG